MKLKQCKPGAFVAYRPHWYKEPFYCEVLDPPLQVGAHKYFTRIKSTRYKGDKPWITTVPVCALELVRPAVSHGQNTSNVKP